VVFEILPKCFFLNESGVYVSGELGFCDFFEGEGEKIRSCIFLFSKRRSASLRSSSALLCAFLYNSRNFVLSGVFIGLAGNNALHIRLASDVR